LQQKPAKPLAVWQRLVFSATTSSHLQFGTTDFEDNQMNQSNAHATAVGIGSPSWLAGWLVGWLIGR